MSPTIQGAPSRPAAAANQPRLRHGFLAAALLVVAGLRLAEGDLVWAAVLAVAGLVEAALAALVSRRTPSSPARTHDGSAHELPQDEVVARSLATHRRSLRLWSAWLVVCTGVAAALLSSAPALSMVLAVLALVSLHRVRRARRSVAVLDRLAVAGAAQAVRT